MAKLKFKDENNEFIPVVQDVKVNGSSTFDGKDANIRLKTINGQSITGSGNIEVQTQGEYVKYTANQGLTTQQKLNARNNIDAVGNDQVKQGTGTSTTDVMSQKGITDELAKKQDNKPDGRNLLIAQDTGKLNLKYMPSTVLGGITNGGTFNDNGIINASSYAPELDGMNITSVQFASYPSYYFIYAGPNVAGFFGYDFAVGDWAISLGNGWAKLNATDAVTSVNGKMGQVILTYEDVEAVKEYWGYDNRNKNLVTDGEGHVTTSDYSLGQILVDYYSELPTNVPPTAKATVRYPEDLYNRYTITEFSNAQQSGEELDHNLLYTYWAPERPTAIGQYVSMYDANSSIIGYYDDSYTTDPCFRLECYDFNNDTSTMYFFSWSEQTIIDTETKIYYDQWTKVWYDPNTGDQLSEPTEWGNIPFLADEIYVDDYYIEESVFANNFYYPETKFAGEYTYIEDTSTEPPTYYWRYTPSNVQADWNEQNPSALSYVIGKPFLNTTITSSLPARESEEIVGTIRLNKIAKTAQYSDLKNAIGRLDADNGGGEIFNTYTGQYKNIASSSAHAEGYGTQATASAAHAEGSYAVASGSSSHAEGVNTLASNTGAHVEGQYTTASGNSSHAEGANYTTASATASHAEGSGTQASGQNSHSEGEATIASGMNSHAEGGASRSVGIDSHAEGYYCRATGEFSHAEGYQTQAQYSSSHSEGYETSCEAAYSHAEGYATVARAIKSHAEGNGTTAGGESSHAEGNASTASYFACHAEGNITSASGNYSHSEGDQTVAVGTASHSEGYFTRANGNYSHAEGYGAVSGGATSHAEGDHTIATGDKQHVEGKYNVEDVSGTYAHIVGNGSNENNRSNAHTLDWSGNAWYQGDVRVGGTDYSTARKLSTITMRVW